MCEQLANQLLQEISGMIELARKEVTQRVNSSLVLLYWRIGKTVLDKVLQDKRAEYGERVVSTIATNLRKQYGEGFNKSSITRMIKFSTTFPDQRIVATLSRQLSWSHFIQIIPLINSQQRRFYAEMCRIYH